jgi:hypothetical protein
VKRTKSNLTTWFNEHHDEFIIANFF